MFRCPMCQRPVGKDKGKLEAHISRCHSAWVRSEQFVNARHATLYILSGSKVRNGICRICHSRPTQFNPKTGKYKPLCEAVACKRKQREISNRNISARYGVSHLMNDPVHQMKLMAARKTAENYWFKDNTPHEYHSSNELEFLEYLDRFHHWPGNDIINTGELLPVLGYIAPDGSKHLYYPDGFIPSMNLVYEIKNTEEGNSGPRLIKALSGIETVKEKAVIESGYRYCFIENNDFSGFDRMVREFRDNDK